MGRVLATLVRDSKLVRVSKGVYAMTRLHKFTKASAPARYMSAMSSVGRAPPKVRSGSERRR
ncbi:hypothetical protein BN2475_580038 [Paraburkholderia ribeironis]|uniref:Uncharacterized protein n=1 Tax=Paraburkholderia ribeironis TaxID=1247936 RepID=A0A1N7SE98_9BURK|nr:hypothetical protein BN2475_580038 [Paraburkholderia ribeironis]